MSKSVLYLTFANGNDAHHLPLLKEESRLLNYILSGLHDKQAIEVHRDESTNVQDLIHSFNRFVNSMTVFHYGGHAGGRGLDLEEGEAGSEGLAQLFSQQKNLKLVFLNGCSTKHQVDRLMELGVKAVIATSVPIQDAKAKDFSAWFYEALTVKRSIKGAFEFAVAALNTNYSSEIPPTIEYRGLKLRREESKALPWGLYVHKDHKTVLDWKLPDMPYEPFNPNPLANYAPNNYLPKILGAMARYDPPLKRVIEDVKSGRKDKRELLPIIIQNLPWTIGAQLQKLISRSESMRAPGIERLQQSINTYVVAAQVLLYILVSQLWEEKRKTGKPLDEQPLSGLLSFDETGIRYFDYVAATAKIGDLFKKHGWTLFVEEYGQIFKALESKKHFYRSYLLLESIREQLSNGSLETSAAPKLCEEAENCLAIFLGSISFLIKYKMVAVRDITVTSTRYQEVAYHHKLGSLNAADSAYLTLDSDPRPFQNHVESGSILLVDNLEEKEIARFLSLSPFIIDNNAFLDKSQESLDIYLFSHVENGDYVYRNVNSQFRKMEQHQTYTISTAYEEAIEVKDEVDFGWEFDESSTKIVQPYQVLKVQFESMKTDLTNI